MHEIAFSFSVGKSAPSIKLKPKFATKQPHDNSCMFIILLRVHHNVTHPQPCLSQSSHVQTTAKAGSPSPQIEYVFKILVVGDPNVGKTSLIQHYVHSVSAGPYKPTVRSRRL